MSIDTIQDIHIEEKDGQWIATVPKIGASVTGATHDEALTNAQRAITRAMIAEAEERKRQTRGQDHTA
jgi:predicted RNase H-like HicB family nuclease